jgi:Caspase domain
LKANYPIDEEMILTDDMTNDPKSMPTRANILNGFKWLREGAKPGDALILHYSGHGGSQKDTDGDEEDGMDETLCPVDYAKNGIIVDDEVHAVLVRGLPKVSYSTLGCCAFVGFFRWWFIALSTTCKSMTHMHAFIHTNTTTITRESA